MNLLPLEPGLEGAVVAGTAGPAVAPYRCAGLTLGVRPEHITVAFERGAAAEVAAIEYLGADSLITCRLGAATLAVRVPGSVGLARGDTTWLSWAPSAQHLFRSDGTRQRRRHSTRSGDAGRMTIETPNPSEEGEPWF